MKKLISILFSILSLYFIQFNCYAETAINSASSKNLTNHNKIDFKLCDNSSKHCVNEYTVLRDIYNNEKIEIINQHEKSLIYNPNLELYIYTLFLKLYK